MRMSLETCLFLLVASAFSVGTVPSERPERQETAGRSETAAADPVVAQPKLLRIRGRFDGSGRIVFTRERAHYEHKHWSPPSDVLFDGEPWTDMDDSPVPWRDFGDRLDLTKAWIVAREGRDLIALEHTPDGFDLYICDSPNGAAEYSVTLAIPRRD